MKIYIHNPKDVVIVKEGNKKNVSVINNIFAKRETKGEKSNIDVNNDP